MPVTPDKPAPYSPAKSILNIIHRVRDRGIPPPIDAVTLGRAGVPETLVPRVLQTLRVLDLITENAQPTPTFEGIRLAPETEYKKRLEDWLKGTYADIFSFVDPAKDGEARIRDAFRNYQPIAQQARMVTLFIGLCTEAGLIAEKAAPTASSPTFTPQQRATARRIVRERLISPRHPSTAGPPLPAALAGLLASLPAEGTGWTAPKRESFLTAFKANLDFCFPILEHEPEEDEGDAEAA